MDEAEDSRADTPLATGSRRVQACLCAFGCFAVSLAVFHPAFGFGWSGFDDELHIIQNEELRLGLSPAGLQWAFTTGFASNWFPLTWLSWMADYQFAGLDAGPYHRTNIVLHGLSSSVLLLALWRLTGSVWRSAFVAVVFALHPLHVESVAWVSERKGVLSGLFFMFALLAYAAYVRRTKSTSRYILVCTMMALGLMAKPVLVTLPFVLLLLDLWPLNRLRGENGEWLDIRLLLDLVREKLPLFGLAGVSSYITFQVQKAGGAVVSTDRLPILDRIQGAVASYVNYLEETFWPNEMAVYYPREELATAEFLLGAALLAAISAASWLMRRNRPYLLVGWLWFIGILVPTIGLVQVGGQARADRYMYLPMIGLSIALAWGLVEALPRSRVVRAAVGAVALSLVAALGFATTVQLAHWKDSVSLMRHTLAITGDNPQIERKLAEGLYHLGEIEEADRRLEHALSLSPRDPMIHVTRAGLELAQGRTESAAEAYQRALEIKPSLWLASERLGRIRMDQHRFEEACALFEQGIQSSSGTRVDLFFELGICLVEAGKFGAAIPWLEHAARQASARNIPTEYAAPYLKLASAARARAPESLMGSDVRSPGLRRAKAELLILAKRPQAAIRELETALRLTRILDYPEPLQQEIQARIDDLDRSSGFFIPRKEREAGNPKAP